VRFVSTVNSTDSKRTIHQHKAIQGRQIKLLQVQVCTDGDAARRRDLQSSIFTLCLCLIPLYADAFAVQLLLLLLLMDETEAGSGSARS